MSKTYLREDKDSLLNLKQSHESTPRSGKFKSMNHLEIAMNNIIHGGVSTDFAGTEIDPELAQVAVTFTRKLTPEQKLKYYEIEINSFFDALELILQTV